MISIFVRFLIHNWNLDCTHMSPSCYLEMKHKKEFIISELWWLPPEHFIKFSDKNCQKSRSCFHRSRFKRSTGFPFIHLGSYEIFSKFVLNYALSEVEKMKNFDRIPFNDNVDRIPMSLFSGNFNKKATNSKSSVTFKTMCFWSSRYRYSTSSPGIFKAPYKITIIMDLK